MQNPMTGSGGMLVGTVEEVGPESPARAGARRPGRHPGLADADPAGHRRTAWRAGTARGEQVPCDGYAILFGRSIAAVLPDDLPAELALAVMDVCGAPGADRPGGGASTSAQRAPAGGRRHRRRRQVRLAVAWPRPGGPAPAARSASSRVEREARSCCEAAGLADEVVARRRPRPGRRSPTPSRPPAGRPTSPSSASTCPAASTARSWPPPTAAPSSSSRWRPRSPRPRSAPRGSPPTSRMLVGNGYTPGPRGLRARRCCATAPGCAPCSRRAWPQAH